MPVLPFLAALAYLPFQDAVLRTPKTYPSRQSRQSAPRSPQGGAEPNVRYFQQALRCLGLFYRQLTKGQCSVLRDQHKRDELQVQGGAEATLAAHAVTLE